MDGYGHRGSRGQGSAGQRLKETPVPPHELPQFPAGLDRGGAKAELAFAAVNRLAVHGFAGWESGYLKEVNKISGDNQADAVAPRLGFRMLRLKEPGKGGIAEEILVSRDTYRRLVPSLVRWRSLTTKRYRGSSGMFPQIADGQPISPRRGQPPSSSSSSSMFSHWWTGPIRPHPLPGKACKRGRSF